MEESLGKSRAWKNWRRREARRVQEEAGERWNVGRGVRPIGLLFGFGICLLGLGKFCLGCFGLGWFG